MPLDKPRNLQHALDFWKHDLDFEPLHIPEPTTARPGSEEKIRVFQERLAKGEDLYHPDDEQLVATKETSSLMHLFVVAEAKQKRAGNRTSEKYKNLYAAVKRIKTNRIRKKGCKA
jgi:hypothetical protein